MPPSQETTLSVERAASMVSLKDKLLKHLVIVWQENGGCDGNVGKGQKSGMVYEWYVLDSWCDCVEPKGLFLFCMTMVETFCTLILTLSFVSPPNVMRRVGGLLKVEC